MSTFLGLDWGAKRYVPPHFILDLTLLFGAGNDGQVGLRVAGSKSVERKLEALLNTPYAPTCYVIPTSMYRTVSWSSV